MDKSLIDRAAALLVGARRNGTLPDGLPAYATPASVAEAHAIQDAVTAGLGKPVGAYKAMAPAHGEPTRGVIYADTIHGSPARVPAAACRSAVWKARSRSYSAATCRRGRRRIRATRWLERWMRALRSSW